MRIVRILASAVLLIAACPAFAQNPFGRITGRIVDPAGGLIPDCAVRVTNLDTNTVVSGASNVEGNFEIPNLNPGNYRIVAEVQGFKRYERGPLEVRVGDVLDLKITLEIGALTETVTVSAESPLAVRHDALHPV